MANQIIDQAKVNMGKTEESLQRELGNIRAGRANASLLNQITWNIMVHRHRSTKWPPLRFQSRVFCK